MTPSEEVLARYRKRETTTDSLGRTITMRVLRPSQNMAVVRMADTEATAVITNFLIAASVERIDAATYTFPQTGGEAGAVLDVLGREGIAAATGAYIKMNDLGGGAPAGESASDGD